MPIPNKPSWTNIPGSINRGIDRIQSWTGWGNQPNTTEIQKQIDDLRTQLEIQKNRARVNYQQDEVQDAGINSTRQKLGELSGEVWALRRDFNYEKLANTAEHKKLWGAITITQKLLQTTILGFPALVKSIIWSILASAAFNALIYGIIGAFNSRVGQDAWNLALRALGLAREAKDDARAAATIAVKAEGKADNAIAEIEWTKKTALAAMKRLESEIEWTKKTALAAMKRLENLINSEIKFLTDSAKNALLRLQERIGNLEKIVTDLNSLVKNLSSEFTKLQSLTAAKLKELTAAVEKLKVDTLKQIEGLKKDIGKIFADLATFAVQIAGIFLTLATIQALLGRLKPGGSVINNNYYYTTNNYTQPDLALLRKIDATTTSNLGVSIGTQSVVQTIDQKCGDQIYGKGGKAIGIGGKLVSGFNWLIVDRAMNMLTLAVTIHNAAMLSQNIVATLTQAMQNVVDLIGVKDDQDNPVELSTLINSSITNFVKNAVGKENYDYWIKQWNYYNRIYQATANLFSSLLSMGDTIVNALNTISGQNAKIGNALRLWGVVGERAYSWFNPEPNFNNPMLVKLQSLSDTASTVEQVSQEPLNVKSAKEQLEAESAALADTLAQKPNGRQGKEIPEAEKVKEEFEAGKDASKGKDVDPTDKMEADD